MPTGIASTNESKLLWDLTPSRMSFSEKLTNSKSYPIKVLLLRIFNKWLLNFRDLYCGPGAEHECYRPSSKPNILHYIWLFDKFVSITLYYRGDWITKICTDSKPIKRHEEENKMGKSDEDLPLRAGVTGKPPVWTSSSSRSLIGLACFLLDIVALHKSLSTTAKNKTIGNEELKKILHQVTWHLSFRTHHVISKSWCRTFDTTSRCLLNHTPLALEGAVWDKGGASVSPSVCFGLDRTSAAALAYRNFREW